MVRAPCSPCLLACPWQDNAKNYQLWNHRRKCALALGGGAARRELEVAAEALAIDAKNYHAWAHRQAIVAVSPRRWSSVVGPWAAAGPPPWQERRTPRRAETCDRGHRGTHTHARSSARTACAERRRPCVACARPAQEFGGALWEEELAYLEQRIRDDLRNNSAWNQRAFVLTHQLRQLAADGGGGAAGPGGGVEGAAGEVADGGELPPTNAAAAAMAGVVVGPALRALLLREVRYVAAQVRLACCFSARASMQGGGSVEAACRAVSGWCLQPQRRAPSLLPLHMYAL